MAKRLARWEQARLSGTQTCHIGKSRPRPACCTHLRFHPKVVTRVSQTCTPPTKRFHRICARRLSESVPSTTRRTRAPVACAKELSLQKMSLRRQAPIIRWFESTLSPAEKHCFWVEGEMDISPDCPSRKARNC